MSDVADRVRDRGVAWLRGALDPPEVRRLAEAFPLDMAAGRRLPDPASLLRSTSLAAQLSEALPSHRAVRAVAFDKSLATNWALPWHQDRVIAVQARHDVSGFVNWTKKDGCWHCEPPLWLLERMVFLRVHLDPCDATTGAMEIAPGSHALGVIPASATGGVVARFDAEVEEAEAGDVLILSMLTLHRSRAATAPAARRVLRIDLSPDALPPPLEWAACPLEISRGSPYLWRSTGVPMPHPNPAALAFLETRRSRPAKTLAGPFPDRDEVKRLLTVAARAPDHGKLEPWRFLVLEAPALARLAGTLPAKGAELGIEPEKIEKAQAELAGSGLAVVVVASPKASDKIPAIEQTLSAGAVCMNLLSAALAAGWGANWLSGWASHDPDWRERNLGLMPHEWIAGFVHLGTETSPPPDHPRPDVDSLTEWIEA